VVSRFPFFRGFCTTARWHCRCYIVAVSGRADAGGRIALHATVCVRVEDLLGWSSGRAGRFSQPRKSLKWTVPSWLPCRVGSAAARLWKSSRRCVLERSICGVHSVGPYGSSIGRPCSPNRTPRDRTRPVNDASPALDACRGSDLSERQRSTEGRSSNASQCRSWSHDRAAVSRSIVPAAHCWSAAVAARPRTNRCTATSSALMRRSSTGRPLMRLLSRRLSTSRMTQFTRG
jgi:hypothetical protein